MYLYSARGVLLLEGGYVYLFLIHCPGGTFIKEGMFIWHYRVYCPLKNILTAMFGKINDRKWKLAFLDT